MTAITMAFVIRPIISIQPIAALYRCDATKTKPGQLAAGTPWRMSSVPTAGRAVPSTCAYRSPPAGLGRHAGTRPSVLLVSRIGAHAEAAGAVRFAAGKGRRDRTLRMEPSVVCSPQTAEIETPPQRCAPKKPGNGVFWTTFTSGEEVS
jgi:hypothetical protein